MKKIILFAIIAFLAIVAVSMIACATSNGNSKNINKNTSNEPKVIVRTIRDIAYGNGIFVSVGTLGYGSKIAYSNDGINWNVVNDPSLLNKENEISSISFCRGMFFAGYSKEKILYSNDGINWKITDILCNKFDYFKKIVDIAYGNGIFVALTDSINGEYAYSFDGLKWDYERYNNGISYNAIAFGNDLFIKVHDYGRESFSDGVTRGRIAVSNTKKRDWRNDLIWDYYESEIFASEDKNDSGGGDIGGIIYVNNKFIIWGGESDVSYYNRKKHDSKIAYSSDGKYWIPVLNTTFGQDAIYDITYGNGRYVAVGKNGKIAYSTDLINWSAVLDPAFGFSNIHKIIYGNNKFIAIGGGNITKGRLYSSGDVKMAYSTDGSSWTSIEFLPSN